MLKKYRYIAVFMMILFFVNTIILHAAPISEVINMPPTIDLSVRPKKKPVDIVIMTDYTGTKLAALNNQINLLKARLENVNVDPVFHVISDMKKIGTQDDEIYIFRRYAYYHFFVLERRRYTPSQGWYNWLNYWDEEYIVWEEIEALASQFHALPKRNPTNITFSVTSESKQTDRYRQTLRHVTVRCSNDVKSSDVITFETFYDNWYNGYYNSLNIESGTSYVTIDTNWKMEEKIRDVSYDVYSLDFNKLTQLPLRSDSDRYMLFLSDASEKDYSLTTGNYFCFGDLTDNIMNYIKDNNFTIYGIVPDDAKDRTLLPDKVSEVLPLSGSALFYMKDGRTLMSQSIYGKQYFLEYTDDFGNVRDVIESYDNLFLLLDNGLIKYYDSSTSTIKTLEGITNAVKVYNFDSYSLHVLDDKGKIYYVNTNNKNVTPFNNSVVITDIYKIGYENIYVTATGIPYMEYNTWDERTREYTYHLLTRAKIKNKETEAIRDMPAIKSAAFFNARAERNSLSPILVHYTNGSIQQFVGITTDYSKSGYREIYTPYLLEDNNYSINESNVSLIESNQICIFILKNDGTVKMLNTDWVQDYYYNRDDDRVYYQRPVLIKNTKTVPLTNVSKMFNTGIERFIFVDINNNMYMYDANSRAPEPVLGTTLKYLGNNIKKVVTSVRLSSYSYSYIYLIYNDGTARQFKYYNTNNNGDMLLPYTNIKDIYTTNTKAYLVTNDGRVYERQNSSSNNFVETFSNPLTIDKSKNYYSLQDLVNTSPDNKFYPLGQYTAALDIIYKKYEDMYSAGSMFILLGEEIEYLPGTYKDRENDPEYQRKWIISHDPDYFDNSMGLSIYHNPTGINDNPPTKLDKVGKYIINLKARDNPKNDNRFDNYRLWSTGDQNLTLYVHRKPIALMNVTVTQNPDETFRIVATDGGSYDLDHTSRADKGIVEWEWAWRDQWDDTWHYERMNKHDATGDRAYIIALRVKDLEGAWSDWIYQTIDNRQPPVAKFDIVKNPITTIETAQIIDTSYAIMSKLTNWHWIVKKINDNGTIGATLQDIKVTESNTGAGGYDTTLNITRTNPGVGKYRIYLRVKADNGLWSDGGTDAAANISNMFYRDLTVVNANEPPTVFLTKTPQFIYEGDTVKVIIYPSDPDGDLLHVQLEEKVNAGSYNVVLNKNNIPADSTLEYIVTDINVGNYDYRVTVTDPDGEIATANLSFTVHELGIVGQVNHTNLWNQNRIKYNQSKTGTNDSPRAYSVFFPGERFVLRADTTPINPLSDIKAETVYAVIQGTTFTDTLSLRSGEITIWDGYIWDESMIRWNNRILNFIFSVRYSNGKIKTDTVTVTIDDDEYWRRKLKF